MGMFQQLNWQNIGRAARSLGLLWFFALALFIGSVFLIDPEEPHLWDKSATSTVQMLSPLQGLAIHPDSYRLKGEFAAALEHGDLYWVFFKVHSWFGEYPLIGFIVSFLVYYVGKDRRGGLVLLAIGLLGGLSHFPIKLFVARLRPHHDAISELLLLTVAPGHSFPSGHTCFYTIVFGFLFFWAQRRVRPLVVRVPLMAISAVMVLLVGTARVYLGAHYASDVLGGYLWGYMWLRIGLLKLNHVRNGTNRAY
jgi:membrane-associated phospholipid phosphatase